MGVYPIEKFEFIGQKEFEDFILTCYESRRFTGEGQITGVMNAATSLLIGSVNLQTAIQKATIFSNMIPKNAMIFLIDTSKYDFATRTYVELCRGRAKGWLEDLGDGIP